jgi:hypothetical protein
MQYFTAFITLLLLTIAPCIFLGGCATAKSNYPITAQPAKEQWDLATTILELKTALPDMIKQEIKKESLKNLLSGQAWTYQYQSGQKMIAQYSMLLIKKPLGTVIEKLPIHRWGEHLANLISSEVTIAEYDKQQRVTKQIERMVINPIATISALNADMTKLELISYQDDRQTLSWRVYHSDNGSTVADVGYLEFRIYDQHHTMITFHSAHILNSLGLIPYYNYGEVTGRMSDFMTKMVLKSAFVGHLKNFRAVIQE